MSFRTVQLNDFTGGLNTTADPRNLQPNECPVFVNATPIKGGGFESVKGSVDLLDTATASPIQGIFQFYPPVGRPQTLFASGHNIYELNSDGTRTKLTSDDVSKARTGFTAVNDVCIITNGVDNIRLWNGTDMTTLDTYPGDMPTEGMPQYSFVWKNKLVLWGDRTNPFQMYFSASGDHTDFTTDNGAFALNIDRAKSEPITAIVPFYDRLMVYTRNAVYAVTGSTTPGSGAGDEISVVPVFQGVGTTSPLSVVNAKNDQVFFDGGVIRSVQSTQNFGDVFAGTLSYRVDSIVSKANRDAMKNAFALYYPQNDEVWFLFPTGSSVYPNRVLVYNIQFSSWSERRGFDGYTAAIVDGYPVIGTVDGRIVKHDFGHTYSGKAIEVEVHTAYFTFGDALRTKKIRSADVTIDTAGKWNIEVKVSWDYQDPSSEFPVVTDPDGDVWNEGLWDSALWGTNRLRQTRRMSGIGFGKLLQLQYRNLYNNQPIRLIATDLAATLTNYRPAARQVQFAHMSYMFPGDLLVDEFGNRIVTETGAGIRVSYDPPS